MDIDKEFIAKMVKDTISENMRQDGLSDDLVNSGVQFHAQCGQLFVDIMPKLSSIMKNHSEFIIHAEKHSDKILAAFVHGIATFVSIEDSEIRETDSSPKH